MEITSSFRRRATLAASLVLAGLALAILLWRSASASQASSGENVLVSLCDGASTFVVPGLKPGEAFAPPEARNVAREMMMLWRQTAGGERWAAWQAEEAMAVKTEPAPGGQTTGLETGQPTKFSERDRLLWKQEEEKWIAEGYKNFHSWQALGGTIGVSCDMCHPDGANTHPETYPKFQMQSKKVSLLRDMINWCIENPMKGKPLPENDPRLRSVEAYILSTRRGVPLDPGKH